METVEDLFEYALAFAHQPVPKGPRVAIITNAGGVGIWQPILAFNMGWRSPPCPNRNSFESIANFHNTLG
ncbi:MAG: hypothetical protein NZ960_04140 [Candidatus Kapabacteria bacterium]|nr:hypothetical protein [Candidatus Kapabacteria bacterium]MDW8012156.1 hypothetical protein [Bacteroidota bacterium]